MSSAGYFGGRAAYYDSRYDRMDADGHALRARLAAVLDVVGDGPGDALDAGMGPGRLAAELQRLGWTVSGVDASEEMVELARERLGGDRDRLRRAEIETLPFPDAGFDLVTATGVLEYADLPCALAELTRVLRPGGSAVVSYPNPGAVYGIWKTRLWYPATRAVKRAARRPNPHLPRGAGELVPASFEAALRVAGLVPRERRHTSFLPVLTPLDRLMPGLTARAGARLEGRSGRTADLLATQVVYLAEKPAPAASRNSSA